MWDAYAYQESLQQKTNSKIYSSNIKQMTKYQQLNDTEKRVIITEINHSLLYDPQAYKQIMDVVKKSNPSKPIILFPKEPPHEN
jgi:hypothetical protein